MPTQPVAPPSAPTPALASQGRFRLTRFYAISSLIGILLVTASLLYTYRLVAEDTLIEHEGRANADLSRALANAIWSDHPDFLTTHPLDRTREQLLADPHIAGIRDRILTKMKGLSIAKVKFYDRNGLTLFSTDEKQIGERKPGNPGLVSALAGKPRSQLSFRDRFDAFEGEIKDRNLIASYVPARAREDGPVEGVVEVYSDVTSLFAQQARARWIIAASFFGLLLLLYLFLAAVVRKADRIIEAQAIDRAERERQALHQALHDPLTRLPNRTAFGQRLTELVVGGRGAGAGLALLFVDLDRFKLVNDSLGHHAGDALLTDVATRIRSCLGQEDLLFRMGGDEFTVLLPGALARDRSPVLAGRIVEAIGRPFNCQGQELSVGASIGIAVFPDDGDTPETLLRNADAAMYGAKAGGRGAFAFYRADLTRDAAARLELEAALKKAMRQGEFVLHYQPRLDAVSRQVIAVEALLRWNSPNRGLVLPDEFIPLLEECGLMPAVGDWVMRNACQQLQLWRKSDPKGLGSLRVSVNISGSQLRHEQLVDTVTRVLHETGVPPQLIEMELTESVLIADLDRARETVEGLRRLGVGISIDDFGVGYASLNYLRHFPVDYLKMDRSLVSGVETGPRDRAIASAILTLGRALGIPVVAEGVETDDQANFFTREQCQELQGFLFCRPLAPALLADFLASRKGGATLEAAAPRAEPPSGLAPEAGHPVLAD